LGRKEGAKGARRHSCRQSVMGGRRRPVAGTLGGGLSDRHANAEREQRRRAPSTWERFIGMSSV
jgi:hypothetical protein